MTPLERTKLIEDNVGLVYTTYKHIPAKEQALCHKDDFISAGFVGLVKGVDSFRMGRGSILLTWLITCIWGHMKNEARRERRQRHFRLGASTNIVVEEDHSIEEEDMNRRLREVLGCLSTEQEAVILSHYWQKRPFGRCLGGRTPGEAKELHEQALDTLYAVLRQKGVLG